MIDAEQARDTAVESVRIKVEKYVEEHMSPIIERAAKAGKFRTYFYVHTDEMEKSFVYRYMNNIIRYLDYLGFRVYTRYDYRACDDILMVEWKEVELRDAVA